MSHYWSLYGEIKFSRDLYVEELQAIADELDCDIATIEEGEAFIHIKGNTMWVEGNENHFPSILNDILKLVDADCIGYGTYHAEDHMSGEWWIEGKTFKNGEYSDLVARLRKALLKEGKLLGRPE
jgi:hypothetical protein